MKACEEVKLRRKIRRVIDSCQTLDQLFVARKFVQLAQKKFDYILITGIEGTIASKLI